MALNLKFERVREGEWNEALCFYSDKHPKTEIAAQKCGDYCNVWFLSSRTWELIKGNLNQSLAENLAKNISEEILNSKNPLKMIENYK